ncbi:hypothetical protein [Coraliomargarita parva]|uniref:hypothetical protein n=1 Tax=Coraliomargarita parva TaxID=3014050 RepID=UPI0022B55BF5|nr:hypothetical protein [Coraliomargarita parva]
MKSLPFLLVCLSLLAGLGNLNANTTERTRGPSIFERIFKNRNEEETQATKKKAEAEAKARKEEAAKKKQAEATKAREAKEAKQAAAKRYSKKEREVLEQWKRETAASSKSKSKKEKEKSLPPGLQKKLERGGELPPGWKKKLQVGSILDKDFERRAISLPDEIRRRLPKAPSGTIDILIEDEIIRVQEKTRRILDILSDRSR